MANPNIKLRTHHLLLALLGSASVLSLFSACTGHSPLASDVNPQGEAPLPAQTSRSVQVIARREGDVTHFSIENREFCEVTVTFEMRLVNLKSSVPLPYTATFPARQTSEAFQVEPIVPEEEWEYSHTNTHKLGTMFAHHDDHHVYHLPYLPGRRFTVTQGYNGSFSHSGANQYAIDWKMPQGTLVCAARAGVVVKLKQDSNKGGGSMKFDRYNNFVLIRHDDGTLAHYCHLQRHGVLVKVGQRVEAGQPIAHSGNTGFSSGPHLHFCVFKAKNGRERESIPVLFQTVEDGVVTLVESRGYESADAVGSAGASTATSTPWQTRKGS